MNKPSILIISNKIDFTTDYVCVELEKQGANYIRINREDFCNYSVHFDALNCRLNLIIENTDYELSNDSLMSIWYRAPIYLRDILQPDITPEEQLYRSQWTAFIRNLSVFQTQLWMNNPESTFRAENKLLQLYIANELGLKCPKTLICNDFPSGINPDTHYIVKPLDTAVLRMEDKEAFVYANIVTGKELQNSELGLAPITLQEYINPKIDLRVTVVDEEVFGTSVENCNGEIIGDWRKEKANAIFKNFKIPNDISDKCIKILKNFKLTFGAFDFALKDDVYYFLEVNPTGEWAWLVEAAGHPIHESISKTLQRNNHGKT